MSSQPQIINVTDVLNELREELIDNPYAIDADQASRLRSLVPHDVDETVSNLPIAEFVYGQEWFWSAIGVLSVEFGNKDWYRDVVKAMLIHAHPDGLAGINNLPWYGKTYIVENLQEIAAAVTAKQNGDLYLYADLLNRFWKNREDSIIGELALEALEKIESAQAGEVIAHLFTHNPVKYYERLKRHHFETHLVSTIEYCKSLRRTMKYFAAIKGISGATAIWHEIYSLSPELIEEWTAQYISRNLRNDNSGDWAGFREFLESSVDEPSNTPEVKRALALTDWLDDPQVNINLEFFGNHSDNRLYGHPCRLAQIKLLRLMLVNWNEPKEKFFNQVRNPKSIWCPIHNCDPSDSLDFVKSYLVKPKKLSDDRLLTNRFATQRFLGLAKSTKKFRISERGMEFLTRKESKGLLPWQNSAIASWAAHGRQGIIAAATGTGKSRIGVAAIIEAYEDGLPIVLLTHRLAIKGQWKKDELLSTAESDITGYLLEKESRIFTLGENVRELSCEDHYTRDDLPNAQPGRVLIALDKSLSDRPELMPKEFEPGLLVADEVHQYNDPTGRIILEGAFDRRLGLSATVSGFDDYGLLPYFGGVKVADYPIYKALRDKVICEYNLLTIRVPYSPVQGFGVTYQKVDLTSKPVKEYSQKDLDAADAQVSALLADILSPALGFPYDPDEDFDAVLDRVILSKHPEFMPLAKKYIRARSEYDKITRKFESQSSVLDLIAPKIKEYGRTLAFANTKVQGKELHDDLFDIGVPVTYIDSDTEQFGRNDAFRALQNDLTKAIISPQILDEGVNIPNAQIGLFLGKGNGKYRQTVQRMGRVLRKKENEDKALLILAVGMYTREDPGAQGEDVFPDSQFAVMAKNCSNFKICDFDEPTEIALCLEELLPQKSN